MALYVKMCQFILRMLCAVVTDGLLRAYYEKVYS